MIGPDLVYLPVVIAEMEPRGDLFHVGSSLVNLMRDFLDEEFAGHSVNGINSVYEIVE